MGIPAMNLEEGRTDPPKRKRRIPGFCRVSASTILTNRYAVALIFYVVTVG